MNKLKFYEVDKEYIKYLQSCETKRRGFTRVPNSGYDTNDKFVCGVVFNFDNFKYYAPISSYLIKQKDNVLIKDKNGNIKSSIRFNYMFPVPDDCLIYKDFSKEPDEKYRSLLEIEYDFCIDNQEIIKNRAKRTYTKVTKKLDKGLVKNSCDFKLLEEKCVEYHEIIKKQEVLDDVVDSVLIDIKSKGIEGQALEVATDEVINKDIIEEETPEKCNKNIQ